MKLLLILAACLAAAQAAIIRNYVNRNCQGNYRMCTNIAPNRCCYHNGAIFKSSRFSYIADTSFGLVCTGTANRPCQTVRAAQHAGGCVQPAGTTTRLRGSYWFDCHQRLTCPRNAVASDLEGKDSDETQQQAPDKVIIDGHIFNIGPGVPADTIARLHQLAETDIKYAAIPDDLKKFEVTGESAKALLAI